MGTLFQQEPRGKTMKFYLHGVREALEFMGFDSDKATAAQWAAAAEVAKAALAIQNADVLDEQLGGFGEILQSIAAALEKIGESGEWLPPLDINGPQAKT